MATNTSKPTAPGGQPEAQAQGQAQESGEPADREAQESALHGFREDDALKRIVRQHPQRGIPQVEDVEPGEAPPKE